MKKKTYKILPVTILFFLLSCSHQTHDPTVITKWQYGKKGAVSLTYDDSTINHFRIALPMMNEFGFPGTFYLITGAIPDSEYQGEFVGRDVNEIIEETVTLQTNKDNFFERASAIRYLGFQDVYQYHRNAGQLFESGDVEEAYQVIDEAYERVRNGDFPVGGSIDQYLYDVLFVEPGTELITWKEIRSFDREFHEFGSHTVTHPYLSVMDEANIRYELEKSKEEIKNQLFSIRLIQIHILLFSHGRTHKDRQLSAWKINPDNMAFLRQNP
ncbi:MAG: polysaccharide deacetylase family protein [Balneolaceae bacterium]